MSPRRALLLGTLTVGVLDITDAFVFFWARNAVAPPVILQSIASGLLGRAAFQGGWPTALLGLGLHFFIAFVIVLVYQVASRRAPSLTRRLWWWGPLYGIAVYVVMNYVVIPLSAASFRPPAPAVLANGLLIHVFGVGIPSAWFASRIRR